MQPIPLRRTLSLAASLLALSGSIALTPIVSLPVQAHSSITQEIAELKRSNVRWIEVNLSRQRLIAWEGRTPVYAVVVSTGTAAHPTLPGVFAIQSKHRQARMQGDDYDIPDVPYTLYYDGSYAIHGAYWHRRFGTPVSHGCVNVAVDHARWLFNWARVGTPVIVHR
ncbi:L,D-transpeptidase [Leptolyngbya ohadii]|uniref:L,D-transpeptidase n=1 Tax=Leptolyngbya ohadii TaxID=1962290 RepID=UPI000B59E9B8|nr:L,D-transpeptidase [Leptolyngbya ohadii]